MHQISTPGAISSAKNGSRRNLPDNGKVFHRAAQITSPGLSPSGIRVDHEMHRIETGAETPSDEYLERRKKV
jgi:hypothetical protein